MATTHLIATFQAESVARAGQVFLLRERGASCLLLSATVGTQWITPNFARLHVLLLACVKFVKLFASSGRKLKKTASLKFQESSTLKTKKRPRHAVMSYLCTFMSGVCVHINDLLVKIVILV